MSKRGLVVEGGGMRGAHSCGALWTMAERGLVDFDVVAATSAGACTVAFFVARQFDLFTQVWQNHLHDGQFIRFRNLPFLQKSVMDLDYLMHDVFRKKAPLDVVALEKSPSLFYITATDCETGTPHYFTNRNGDILTSLKASSAIPLAYRTPVVINGRRYVDGGITDPIPIGKAIEEGCDEIVVILTRTEGYRKKKPLTHLIPKLYEKKFPALAEALKRRWLVYNETMARIERGDYPARLTVIRPRTKLPVGRMTAKREKLIDAIQRGYQDALLALTSASASNKIEVSSRG